MKGETVPPSVIDSVGEFKTSPGGRVKFLPEWKGRGGGLKSDRGSPWRIVCSAVFLSNMESEVSVPLSLLQRTFEPHRESSWQSQTPPLPLCYLLGKLDEWIMKLSKLLLLHIPQPHVGALSVSVVHFGLIFSSKSSICLVLLMLE